MFAVQPVTVMLLREREGMEEGGEEKREDVF
jgi:hypothetical protein